MKSPILDRIHFVTRHFDELQGSRLAGLGLMLLSMGVGPFGRSMRAALPVLCLRLALLAGWGVLTFFGKAYYKKRFGEVQPLGEPIPHLEALSIYSSGAAPQVRYAKKFDAWMLPRMLLIGGGCLMVYVALRKISPTVHVQMQSTSVPAYAIGQQLIAMALASLFLSVWISRGYRLSQGYYLVLGLVMLGLSALGASMGLVLAALAGQPELSHIAGPLLPAVYSLVYDNESGYLVCGACLLIAGLLDHRQLVQVFKPVVREPSR